MKPTKLYLLFLVAFFASMANSQDISLDRCKYLQERIEYYTQLRKQGGSASQMESWKKSRRKYEDEFREGDCYKYAISLR